MGLSIMTNIASLAAQRNLNIANERMMRSVQRLSSGMRINNAADDAAGLGISENLKADIRSLIQARRNANDAISMTQVTEGAMNEMQGLVSRMREIAVQAANGTLGAIERGYIQTEFDQLRDEINRISAVTEFNGQLMLDGSASAGLIMQVGIQDTVSDRIALSVERLTTSTIGATTSVASASLSTATGAQGALNIFDAAITQLSTARSKLGAMQNRVQITINNLEVYHQNLSAANSNIRDADIADETSQMTRNQILTQAGVSILGQANQLPAAALSLLGS